MKEPPPQTRKRTKNSKVSYQNLREWLKKLWKIQERWASRQADLVLRQHFEGLPLSYVRRCRDQDILEQVAQEIKEFRPPRGQRKDHFTTRLLMEVNNQIARLKEK